MQTLIQDLRYSVRMLWKKPGFTLIAIVTLALGIGVNTALFTGFNIFLRPKPVKDPDTLVQIMYESQGRDGVRRDNDFSFPDYSYFRDHTQVFSDLIAQQDEKLGGTAGVLLAWWRMTLVLLGILIGLPASLAVSQVMKSLLFGLPAADPITFTVVLTLLMSAGLMACYIPARRATKVDPLVALRYE